MDEWNLNNYTFRKTQTERVLFGNVDVFLLQFPAKIIMLIIMDFLLFKSESFRA